MVEFDFWGLVFAMTYTSEREHGVKSLLYFGMEELSERIATTIRCVGAPDDRLTPNRRVHARARPSRTKGNIAHVDRKV